MTTLGDLVARLLKEDQNKPVRVSSPHVTTDQPRLEPAERRVAHLVSDEGDYISIVEMNYWPVGCNPQKSKG